MSGKADGGVPVTFADGVRDDVASLAASADDEASASELAALKRRIAELLVECKANPYLGEMMGLRAASRACLLPEGPIRRPDAPRQAALPAHLPQRAIRRGAGRVSLARDRASCGAASAPAGEPTLAAWSVRGL